MRDDRGSHSRHEHQFLQAARRCVRRRRPPIYVAEAHELVGCFVPYVRRSPALAVLATTSMVTSPSATSISDMSPAHDVLLALRK
jgi:hypothetical protein